LKTCSGKEMTWAAELAAQLKTSNAAEVAYEN